MLVDAKTIAKVRLLENRYAAFMFAPVQPVAAQFACTREHFRTPPDPTTGLTWKAAEPGTVWGEAWGSAWFRCAVKLGPETEGKAVYLRARTGAGEALLLLDGVPAGVIDGNHPVVMLTGRGEAGRVYDVAVEAYAGHPCVGTQPDDRGIDTYQRVYESMDLVLAREDVLAFVFDLKVLLSLMDALPPDNGRRAQVAAGLAAVWAVVEALPDERPESVWRPRLARARQLMRPLLAARNGDSAPRMGIVGHSHIDTAWLWPVAETWRKCARTFSSVLNLMDQYPEFIFTQSAPYHAEAIERLYPALLPRIRQRVAEGRWEVNGGMYVEPDCNIPSGESFVRQFLIGQQTTERLFGRRSDAFWQPDVFGYSAALPQIMRGCGVEFFLTTKIAWNDTTRFPYDTFWWRGIDGTPVLAHFNRIHCWPDPKTLCEQYADLQHKDVEDRRLAAIGYGDGGGGPQFEMLEVARRVGDLDGVPRASYATVSAFMTALRDEQGPVLPEYVGELYLEGHRGTLTSIAAIKRGNRRAELALRDAEFMAVTAALRGRSYPADDLRAAWKELLLNQFHDILPGSSIPEVNDEAVAGLERCRQQAATITEQALGSLVGGGPSASHLLVANSLSWERGRTLALPGVPAGLIPADSGSRCQRVCDLAGRELTLVDGVALPPLGARRVDLRPGDGGGESPFRVTDRGVETPWARLRFDRRGRITSFVDRNTGRELVRRGAAFNAFHLGEDVPAAWDNWDIDADHRLKLAVDGELISREVAADGPLQLRLRCTWRLGEGSQLRQDVVFHATTAQVDFETEIDWGEQHRLLKAVFATDLLSPTVRHEIQYGHAERPTHLNRPYDRARFEVCNHKWSDLSENRFGVALLNDGKYGLGAKGGELALTLVKAGTHPDPRAERGRHRFTYSLLPHAGGFAAETVVRPAYELNVAPMACPVSADAPAVPSLLTVSAPNVIVEAVKWAEDGDGFVARLYECERSGTATRIGFGVPVARVCEANMLEEEEREMPLRRDAVTTRFRPFEIKTLRVYPR